MADSPSEKTLRRVLLISAIDGWSIAILAGFCTLISLLFGEWIGVLVAALITAGGVIELRGRGLLTRGDERGLSHLVRAQLLVLGTIWVYSLGNMISYDEELIMAQFTPELRSLLTQAGLSVDQLRPMLKPVFFGFYLVVIAVTLLFQGGLALYYHSRRPKIAEALAGRRPAPPLPGVPPVT